MWVGGIRMSTIATSGRCSRTAAQELVGVAGLADDLEAGLDEQPGDPLAQEERVVGEDEPEGHAPATRARIAAPDSSSLGMKPEDPAARRGAARTRSPRGSRSARRAAAVRRPRARGRPRTPRRRAGRCRAGRGPAGATRAAARPGRAVVGLADDVEAVGLEQGARLDAEAGVVVDDEDGVHGAIVARREPASPTGLSRTQG